MDELMRIILILNADHEGGNPIAHATHLTASTLPDPYLAYSCGINALAGPLNGNASNINFLIFIESVQHQLKTNGKDINKNNVAEIIWKTLHPHL